MDKTLPHIARRGPGETERKRDSLRPLANAEFGAIDNIVIKLPGICPGIVQMLWYLPPQFQLRVGNFGGTSPTSVFFQFAS